MTSLQIQDLVPSQDPVFMGNRPDTLIASYNWLRSEQPSLYVPGSAPQLKETVDVPFTLSKDAGNSNIDANAAHWPMSPFEPAFRAAAICSPGFSFDDVDVVINRNSLRKFFDICRGSGPRQSVFRLNLFCEGKKTLIVERCERFAVAVGPNPQYGKAFEEACTSHIPGLEQSECHHRVVTYHLGNLKCAVRFEVDALIPSEETLTPNEPAETVDSRGPSGDGIKIIHSGCAGGRDHIVELKSRAGRTTTVAQHMPQLWFGRVEHLVQGVHEGGTFSLVRTDEVRKHVEA
jgi:hypothetical protein